MTSIDLLKRALFVAALIPAAALAYHAYVGDLTANPVEYITDQTGTWALTCLMASLTITPIRRFTGWNAIIRLRRMIGLFAFFYATLHMLTWVGLVSFFDLPTMVEDVAMRPYITVGMATFLILAVLAATSNRLAIEIAGLALAASSSPRLRGRRRGHRPLLVAGEGRYDGATPVGGGVDRAARAAGLLDLQGADVVAILTRAPSAGGKTRLFSALEVPYDPTLSASLLLDTLDGVCAPRVRHVVVVTPPEGIDEVRDLVGNCAVFTQSGVSLGDRMRGAMRHCLAWGARAVAVVGSDVPAITPAHITSAFTLLADDPTALVLGPAHDGGYYLIAATSVPPVFDGIAWGTGDVFQHTCERAAEAGWPVRVLGALADVDRVTDLVDAVVSCPASRTAAWAQRVMPRLIRDLYGRA